MNQLELDEIAAKKRYPSNIFRQSWTPTRIRMNEAFVFGVKVDGGGQEALFALDTLASKAYEPGMKVQIAFEERGLPPLWARLRIRGISPL